MTKIKELEGFVECIKEKIIKNIIRNEHMYEFELWHPRNIDFSFSRLGSKLHITCYIHPEGYGREYKSTATLELEVQIPEDFRINYIFQCRTEGVHIHEDEDEIEAWCNSVEKIKIMQSSDGESITIYVLS